LEIDPAHLSEDLQQISRRLADGNLLHGKETCGVISQDQAGLAQGLKLLTERVPIEDMLRSVGQQPCLATVHDGHLAHLAQEDTPACTHP
jgi:hypothetical protein